MPMNVARYRNLKHYKYQLVSDYVIAIDIKPRDNVRTSFIDLDTQGTLTIKNGYAWDGPSGLGIDTRSFMRASLVHDALYQLMRAEYLDYRIQQRAADDFLRTLCVEDGMWKLRAWFNCMVLLLFGKMSARPAPEPKDEIICIP